MRVSSVLFALIAMLALLGGALADPDGCEGSTKTQCEGIDACVWCESAAVPSACYPAKLAPQLPPAVFTCEKKN